MMLNSIFWKMHMDTYGHVNAMFFIYHMRAYGGTWYISWVLQMLVSMLLLRMVSMKPFILYISIRGETVLEKYFLKEIWMSLDAVVDLIATTTSPCKFTQITSRVSFLYRATTFGAQRSPVIFLCFMYLHVLQCYFVPFDSLSSCLFIT